jgi:predicted nucleic acid-binding protein
VIYLDASALVTATVRRAHADDLRAYLDVTPGPTGTSTIGFVETVRTCDRIGSYPNLLASLLSDHEEVYLSDRVRDDAARLPGGLRSLDAVHVASAAQFGSELIALVTYDQRMAEAARSAGLPVAMPGLK